MRTPAAVTATMSTLTGLLLIALATAPVTRFVATALALL